MASLDDIRENGLSVGGGDPEERHRNARKHWERLGAETLVAHETRGQSSLSVGVAPDDTICIYVSRPHEDGGMPWETVLAGIPYGARTPDLVGDVSWLVDECFEQFSRAVERESKGA